MSGSSRSSYYATSWRSSGVAGSGRSTRPSTRPCSLRRARLLPPERWSCFAVSPQTLRRWHRALLEGGRRRCRRSPARPPLAGETRGLIGRLARENPRWGYVRIEGEMLKLGISLSATTIATVLRNSCLGPAPRRIGPSWPKFLPAQAHSILASSPSSAAGDPYLGNDGSEPSGSLQVGPDRQGQPLLPGGCCPATFSFSSRVEPFGATAAARSARGPRAVAAATVASIACSLRTPKRRPALVPQPSAQARCQSHPVRARLRRQPHIGSSRETARIFSPRRRRGQSTTSLNCTPEPSFFTPQPV